MGSEDHVTPQSPESVQNLTISARCSSHGREDCLAPYKSFRVGTRGWRLFPFISNLNLSGRLNALQMVNWRMQSVGSPCKKCLPSAQILNKFLDLLLQLSDFGARKRRIFRHKAFAHTVLVGFHLEIC